MQNSSEILAKAGATASAAGLAGVGAILPDYYLMAVAGGVGGGIIRYLAPSDGIAPFWPNGVRLIVLGLLIAAIFWPVAGPVAQNLFGMRLDLEPVVAAIVGGGLCGLFGVTVIEYAFEDLGARRAKKKREADGPSDS